MASSSAVRTTRPARDRTASGRGPSPFAALLSEVRDAGLLVKRPGYYVVVAAINGLAAGAALVAFFLLRGTEWEFVVAAVLGIVLAQFGFLAHEAAHRQVFERGPANDLAARIIGPAVVGMSYTQWQEGHNRHHAHPNVVSRDPSIDPSVFVFRKEDAPATSALHRRIMGVQGFLVPPALLLEGLALRLGSLAELVRRRPDKERLLDLVLLLLRLIALPAFVLSVLPLWSGLAFLAVQSAVFGVYLGGSFIPNHVGMPILERAHGLDYLHKQVLTSRNIRGGVLMSTITGGLSLQIEHHLFPGMSRPNLTKVQPLVMAHCEANGIPYVEVSAVSAWVRVIRYLNGVGGRIRGSFQCPIDEQCGRA